MKKPLLLLATLVGAPAQAFTITGGIQHDIIHVITIESVDPVASGFIKWDAAFVLDAIEQNCPGDECELDLFVDVPIIAARLPMFGHVFETQDFILSLVFNAGLSISSFDLWLNVGNSTPFSLSGTQDPCLAMAVGPGDGPFLHYLVNGHSFVGESDGDGTVRFTAPEPGTLVLLGIGLLGPGLSRRRRADFAT